METARTELTKLLVRQGLGLRTVGAVEAGIKSAGTVSTESVDADGPQVARQVREEKATMHGGGMGMTSMNQWRTVRARPSLMIADGGKS